MSFDLDHFNKYNLFYDLGIPSLNLNERSFINTFNENESSLSLDYENIFLEGPTDYITKLKNSIYEKKLSKDDVYTFEKIKQIFENNLTSDLFKQILNNFDYDSDLEKAEMKFFGKKRKKAYNSITTLKRLKYSKGRKAKNDYSHRYHNKNTPDNIIKKIKAKLFENMLQFINNILNQNSINEKKKILKDIDYKYINRLQKDYDLSLIDTPIKDLLSFDVSSKFKCPKDTNKKTIEFLIEKKDNDKFLMFALNMKFREWLDLFTLKKDIKEFSETFSKELVKNMTRIDEMLKDILSKNIDNNYISSFVFYLYNYENWFIMKKPIKKELMI